MMTVDLLGILQRLAEAEVDFVLIGGLAATVHGSPTVTGDVDICHDTRGQNLERLSSLLMELHARLRGVEGVPWQPDPDALSISSMLTLSTDLGPLDLLAAPAPFTGYDEVVARARPVDVGLDRPLLVVSLDGLIAMKAAAGRPKDRVEIEILEALRDEARSR